MEKDDAGVRLSPLSPYPYCTGFHGHGTHSDLPGAGSSHRGMATIPE